MITAYEPGQDDALHDAVSFLFLRRGREGDTCFRARIFSGGRAIVSIPRLVSESLVAAVSLFIPARHRPLETLGVVRVLVSRRLALARIPGRCTSPRWFPSHCCCAVLRRCPSRGRAMRLAWPWVCSSDLGDRPWNGAGDENLPGGASPLQVRARSIAWCHVAGMGSVRWSRRESTVSPPCAITTARTGYPAGAVAEHGALFIFCTSPPRYSSYRFVWQSMLNLAAPRRAAVAAHCSSLLSPR